MSEEVQETIRNKEDFKAKKDAAVNELTKTLQLEEEKDSIMNCASQFGSFLKNNALIPYNDAFKDYIDMLIYDEKSKTGNTINWKQIRKTRERQKDLRTEEECSGQISAKFERKLY